jgi:hypothetical protein
MTKYQIVWRWPALCKGLHCVVIRTPYPIRIREGFKKELCQQFTVLHIRLSYTLQFSQKVIWKVQKGEVSPLSAATANRTGPVFRHPLYGDTP